MKSFYQFPTSLGAGCFEMEGSLPWRRKREKRERSGPGGSAVHRPGFLPGEPSSHSLEVDRPRVCTCVGVRVCAGCWQGCAGLRFHTLRSPSLSPAGHPRRALWAELRAPHSHTSATLGALVRILRCHHMNQGRELVRHSRTSNVHFPVVVSAQPL